MKPGIDKNGDYERKQYPSQPVWYSWMGKDNHDHCKQGKDLKS